MKGPTPNQRKVLAFIAQHIREFGYPPSMREIAAFVGSKNNHVGHSYTRALALKGLLTRADKVSRGIALTAAGRALLSGRLD